MCLTQNLFSPNYVINKEKCKFRFLWINSQYWSQAPNLCLRWAWKEYLLYIFLYSFKANWYSHNWKSISLNTNTYIKVNFWNKYFPIDFLHDFTVSHVHAPPTVLLVLATIVENHFHFLRIAQEILFFYMLTTRINMLNLIFMSP